MLTTSYGDRSPGEHFQECLSNNPEELSERVLDDLRSLIADWVDKKIAQDIEPTMNDFYEELPCFDHRGMYDNLIEAAIKRVTELT